MNTINVTIQLCEEDRKRIDELIAFSGLLVGEVRSYRDALKFQAPAQVPLVVEAQPKVTEFTVADENPDPTPVVETPAQEPVAEPVPEVKPVSLAEFQKAVTIAVSKSPAAKAAAREIIHKYASSVSAVPENKRAEVIAELSKI